MAAYLIADVDITDMAMFDEYRREVPATEALYGGRYLARGGATRVLEGDWEPHRLVIVEFPDMAALTGWYDSPEYARLKEIRFRCANTRIIALEGAPAA
ncbi:D-fructose-6-phosphate amidotransferase [Mesorhizobium loti]|uniref:D-fructose-6-phosphate amidotransferase n=1 Tax=Rhizobium loti TaxID=381 RepID=A0A101KQH8_RHILI|nr:D-fructose-6-phosphate amidotransferase [Mesorhizobium loti]